MKNKRILTDYKKVDQGFNYIKSFFMNNLVVDMSRNFIYTLTKGDKDSIASRIIRKDNSVLENIDKDLNIVNIFSNNLDVLWEQSYKFGNSNAIENSIRMDNEKNPKFKSINSLIAEFATSTKEEEKTKYAINNNNSVGIVKKGTPYKGSKKISDLLKDFPNQVKRSDSVYQPYASDIRKRDIAEKQMTVLMNDAPIQMTSFGKEYLKERKLTLATNYQAEYRNNIKKAIKNYIQSDLDISREKDLIDVLTGKNDAQFKALQKLSKTNKENVIIPEEIALSTGLKGRKTGKNLEISKGNLDTFIKKDYGLSKKGQNNQGYQGGVSSQPYERAYKIALTEIPAAYNLGRINVFIQEGYIEFSWKSILEIKKNKFQEGTCVFCSSKNGDVISLDELLDNKGQMRDIKSRYSMSNSNNCYIPPAHPFCNCWLEPTGKKDKDKAKQSIITKVVNTAKVINNINTVVSTANVANNMVKNYILKKEEEEELLRKSLLQKTLILTSAAMFYYFFKKHPALASGVKSVATTAIEKKGTTILQNLIANKQSIANLTTEVQSLGVRSLSPDPLINTLKGNQQIARQLVASNVRSSISQIIPNKQTLSKLLKELPKSLDSIPENFLVGKVNSIEEKALMQQAELFLNSVIQDLKQNKQSLSKNKLLDFIYKQEQTSSNIIPKVIGSTSNRIPKQKEGINLSEVDRLNKMKQIELNALAVESSLDENVIIEYKQIAKQYKSKIAEGDEYAKRKYLTAIKDLRERDYALHLEQKERMLVLEDLKILKEKAKVSQDIELEKYLDDFIYANDGLNKKIIKERSDINSSLYGKEKEELIKYKDLDIADDLEKEIKLSIRNNTNQYRKYRASAGTTLSKASEEILKLNNAIENVLSIDLPSDYKIRFIDRTLKTISDIESKVNSIDKKTLLLDTIVEDSYILGRINPNQTMEKSIPYYKDIRKEIEFNGNIADNVQSIRSNLKQIELNLGKEQIRLSKG